MATYTWDILRNIPPPPPGFNIDELGWTVAANQDGHLEIFSVAADGAIWHLWQLGPDSTAWSDWASFGLPPGAAMSPPFPGAGVSQGVDPIALQNADGRLELFVADWQNSIWHIWQVAPNVNWQTEWSPLGQPTNSLNHFKAFLDSGRCIQLIAQSVEVFSRGQTAPNGNWEDEWVTLGSPPPACSACIVTGLGRSVFDRVYVTSGNNLSESSVPSYVSQKSAFVAGAETWSGWKLSSLTTPKQVNGIFLNFAASNQDKRIEMFGLDDGSWDLWHTWQDAHDNWSGVWDNLGRPADSPGDRGTIVFDVARDQLERITVVRWQPESDGGLYTIAQTQANNGWGVWSPVTSFPPNRFSNRNVRLVPQASGLLMIVGRSFNGDLFYIPQLRQD